MENAAELAHYEANFQVLDLVCSGHTRPRPDRDGVLENGWFVSMAASRETDRDSGDGFFLWVNPGEALGIPIFLSVISFTARNRCTLIIDV